MDLSTYKFPQVTKVNLAFPTFDTPKELVEEAEKRNPQKGKKVTSHKYFNVDLFALVSDDTQDTKLKGKLAIDKLRAMLGWFDMQDATLSDKFLTIEQMEKVFDFANEKGYEFLDNQFLNSGELEDSEIKEIQNFITEVQNNY